MYRRLVYFLEKHNEAGRLNHIPLHEGESLDIFHLSTAEHLTIFLEDVFTRQPRMQARIASHLSMEEIRAGFADATSFFSNHPISFHKPEALGHRIQRPELAILLYSIKASPKAADARHLRVGFTKSGAREKIVIHGDGSIWKGNFWCRCTRRLLRPLLPWLTPLRDREEEKIFLSRALPDPGPVAPSACDDPQAPGERLILFTIPWRIEQCRRTGLVIKTGLFTVQADPALYEEGYHTQIYFDERVDWAGRLNEYQERRWRNMLRVGVIPPGAVDPKPRALDLGCGPGMLAAKLSSEGFDTDGADYSKTAINKAISEFPQVRFFLGGAEELIQLGMKYDLIALSHVLEHLRDDGRFLQAVKLLMKPEGRLYIEVPWFDLQAIRKRPFWYRQWDHYREYTKCALACVVRENGLEILDHADSLQSEGQEPYQFLLARIKE